MAHNASNAISYLLVIADKHKEDLASIWQWSNLKIAFEGQQIWVKDFEEVQINSLEVKSIPYKTIYYARQEKLFLLGSLLPDRNLPGLLWTPISRALPIKLPSFNYNYFGINDKVTLSLVPSESEAESVAMICTLDILGKYIEEAPAIRLQSLTWTVLDKSRAMVLGKPLLPVQGDVYWKRDQFLIPAGFDFDLYLLTEAMNHLLNPDNNYWIVWNMDNSCFLVRKNTFAASTLSSFRKTHNSLSTL